MGRFSPRPHNLAPYRAGDSALTRGITRGLGTVTDLIDQTRRTSVLEQEAESREKMRDIQMQEIIWRLDQAEIQRAHEWGYRDEAPVVAEGPSTEQPQQVPGAETAIPKTQQMPVYAEGESSESEGTGKAPPGGNVSEGGSTGMPGFANSPVPIIQGTEIPGDRFPRVEVPGGSMLEQPRSFHQGTEALRGAHSELYGDEMPGVSDALAQGLQPYQPRAGRRSMDDEMALINERAEASARNRAPNAGEQAREFKQEENRAEAYAASLVSSGMDEMEALREAEAVYGVYPDVGTVHRQLDLIRNQLESVYRYIGLPQNNWQAHAIRSIVIGGQSIDEAVYDYRAAADPSSEFGIEDPVTGEQRKMTQEEYDDIIAYIDKYGSVDNKSQVPWGTWTPQPLGGETQQ